MKIQVNQGIFHDYPLERVFNYDGHVRKLKSQLSQEAGQIEQLLQPGEQK